MSRLRRRVASMGSNQANAQAGFQPVTGGAASPAAVGVMPLAQVMVYPHPGDGYSSIAYRGLAPIYTSGSLGGGAAVPASSPGRWGQLIAAGRP